MTIRQQLRRQFCECDAETQRVTTRVVQRLRRLGVDVIEAPWETIGYRLLDRYLAAKRAEAVG
jgi:uncharacterized protein (DUF58 family)